MTYNVSSGTLSLYTTTTYSIKRSGQLQSVHEEPADSAKTG